MQCSEAHRAALSSPVTLVEVGPRDGLQLEEPLETDLKLEIIQGLADAGLRHIQVAAFVHPERVPQMADAEALFERLPRRPEVFYSALVLNPRGLERARAAGVEDVEISVSASDAHSRRNAGISSEYAVEAGVAMIRDARERGMRVRGGIQCAFGCVFEGDVPEERVAAVAARFRDAGAQSLALADTTGMADPVKIRRVLARLAPVLEEIPPILHLHDTRGLGLVNVLTGLECGIRRFDTALGGMGGCPFVPGAAGNVSTEDTAYLLAALGRETGVDIAKVAACSRRLESRLGKRFTGRNHRLQGGSENASD